MLSQETVVDIAGWAGAGLLLLAYALVSFRRLPGDSVRFQLLNLAGGVLLAVNSGYHGAMPSVAVNAVWIVIGLGALLRARRRRGGSRLDPSVGESDAIY
jgi:hypothetical protein